MAEKTDSEQGAFSIKKMLNPATSTSWNLGLFRAWSLFSEGTSHYCRNEGRGVIVEEDGQRRVGAEVSDLVWKDLRKMGAAAPAGSESPDVSTVLDAIAREIAKKLNGIPLGTLELKSMESSTVFKKSEQGECSEEADRFVGSELRISRMPDAVLALIRDRVWKLLDL